MGGCLGIFFRHAFLVLLQGELDDLGQVQGTAVRGLGNLFTTTEAIGDEKCVPGGRADGGQQDALPTFDGDVVVVFLKAEGTSHPAATSVEYRVVEPELVEDSLLGSGAHDGFVMAVQVNDGLALQWRGGPSPLLPFKELA